MAHDGRMARRIGILGQGAWGRTLASLFRSSGHRISTWSRRQGAPAETLLPGQDLIVCAVAMSGVPELSRTLSPHWPAGLPLLSATKGIDPEQLFTASQLWQNAIEGLATVVLSGPNLATELEQGLPAASVLGSVHTELAERLQQDLSGDTFRLYTNQDPVGTEIAGALKNVMAVAAGVCDGLGLGTNARASLLTRGLAEMGRLGHDLGGDPDTLYGLAGLGDLLATANSHLSRNFRFGLLLAEGLTAPQAIARIGATVEGASTAAAALALARRSGWTPPICEQVVAMIEGESSPQLAVKVLMERTLRSEVG